MSKLLSTTLATAIILASTISLVSPQAPVGSPFASTGPSAARGGAPSLSIATPPVSATSGPTAPGPAEDPCLDPLLNLTDCLSYVENGSTVDVPDKACCPELAGLVESHPVCLCELLSKGGSSVGVSIDLNKALKLPSVCHVQTPSLTLCSAAGYPVAAPTSSVVSNPPGIDANPLKGNDSGASSIEKSAQSLCVILAVTSVLTFF